MDTENTSQQTNQAQIAPENQPIQNILNNQKGNVPIILGAIVVLLIVGAGAYYLGTQKNNASTNIGQNVTPSTTPTNQTSTTASPTQATNQQASSVPSDWTLKSSTYCGVKFPVPPNKEPYFEFIGQDSSNPQYRRFWQLREGNQASDGHKIFANSSSLMYVADIEASGYIAGHVGVRCAPNTSYTLANIAENYASGFGADAGIKVKSKRTTNIWGKDVVAAKIEGGMFSDNEIYFVVTSKNVYKIDKRSDSDKELVRNTTDQIFNNLQFTN